MRLTLRHLAAIAGLVFASSVAHFFGGEVGAFFIYAAILYASVSVSMLFLDKLIPRLKYVGMTGKDENKAGEPDIPEMGGIAVIAGFAAGSLLAISLLPVQPFNLVSLLAAIIAIYSIAFMGFVDDLISIPQWLKAVLPLFAAVPLMVVPDIVGSTAMNIPFLGMVDFGMVYIFVLMPLAIAVCSNLTNMLAGFNGMEAGMGIVMFATLSLLALSTGSVEMLLISLPMLGALGGFLYFNWHPARVFPGDVANLTIGVTVAATVIIGDLESAGVILMMPYIADFFIKAANRFPHTRQELREGKLYPKDGKIRGLVHVVMKAFNGISERNLVLVFIGLEVFFAAIALALFFRI